MKQKRLILIVMAAMMAVVPAVAQEVFSKPKLSGFFMGQYQATFQEDANSNSFNVRIARAAVDGRILQDFYYKMQVQFNGNTTTLGSSPRLVDLFAEWQHFEFFKVKVGQFKRPFTFENPMNPIDQGFMGYSQNVQRLSGFSDRTGEHSSNGRDIGVQLQGDFLKNSSGRNLLHYQVGVFNGQGINVKDVDERKDLIGGVWVMPIKGMRLGVFGWEGSHARKGTYTDQNGNEGSGVVSLRQHRYAFSAEYKANDMQLRAEYIHSTGYGFKTTYQKSENSSDATVNWANGNKADGFYALAIVPVTRDHKLRAKGRYDLYRKQANWGTSRTQYEIGLNYQFIKNIEIQTEYALINDRTLADGHHNYSTIDLELCVRF